MLWWFVLSCCKGWNLFPVSFTLHFQTCTNGVCCDPELSCGNVCCNPANPSCATFSNQTYGCCTLNQFGCGNRRCCNLNTTCCIGRYGETCCNVNEES